VASSVFFASFLIAFTIYVAIIGPDKVKSDSGCERLNGDLAPLAGMTSLQSLNLSGGIGIRQFTSLVPLALYRNSAVSARQRSADSKSGSPRSEELMKIMNKENDTTAGSPRINPGIGGRIGTITTASHSGV